MRVHVPGRGGSLRAQAAHVAQAGGVAVVVGDDDGGVERLEVQHQHTAAVEARLGLHDQRDALGGSLLGALLHAGRHRDVVQRLGQTQHHGLHPVLEGEEPAVTNHGPLPELRVCPNTTSSC